MKKARIVLLVIGLCLIASGLALENSADATRILLSDAGVTVNGQPASTNEKDAVYTANDVVFYLAGQDFTYGEGTEADAHTPEEAAAHTVVHITRPGTYELSGTLSAGQVAVDVKSAKKDPDAVVTLILNGVDISSTVSPAIIFYNVYECGDDDEGDATMNVDTSAAGANIVIADGTVNNLNGSYVARIYDPETVELNKGGTKVKDAKKLHKYDGALYSKRSMNIFGGEKGDGVLNIVAENEGLCSDLHLTIHGGTINITSGNDGINASEDNVSVATINGGNVNITVAGWTGEGDGIDSNGWLLFNGGTVTTSACGFSMDSGVDADKGIYLNGGTLCASGNMYDHIAGGSVPHAAFSFSGRMPGGTMLTLRNAEGQPVGEWTPTNDFSILVVGGEALAPGSYTLWQGETQLGFTGNGVTGFGGGMPPMGEMPDFPEGFDPSNMPPPEGFDPATMPAPPEGFDPAQMPPMGGPGRGQQPEGPLQTEFVLDETGGSFSGVKAAE